MVQCPSDVQCTCGAVQSSKAVFNALKRGSRTTKQWFNALRAFNAAELRFKRHYVPFKVLSPLRYESGIAERNAPAGGSKRVEPGDDIAENFFRDGFFDIAVFCGCTRLGVLEQVVEARVDFGEAPLRLPPVGGGG